MINKTKLDKIEVEFIVGSRPFCFPIYTNVLGYEVPFIWLIEDWMRQTKSYSPKNFCRFIMRQDPAFVAMTQEQFTRMMQAVYN